MAQFTARNEALAQAARLSRKTARVYRSLVENAEFAGIPLDNGDRFDPFYLDKSCPARMSERVYYRELETLERRGLYRHVDFAHWGDVRTM